MQRVKEEEPDWGSEAPSSPSPVSEAPPSPSPLSEAPPSPQVNAALLPRGRGRPQLTEEKRAEREEALRAASEAKLLAKIKKKKKQERQKEKKLEVAKLKEERKKARTEMVAANRRRPSQLEAAGRAARASSSGFHRPRLAGESVMDGIDGIRATSWQDRGANELGLDSSLDFTGGC